MDRNEGPSQVHDELRSIRRELQELQDLKAKLQLGEAILLIHNQAAPDNYPAKEIEDCEALILNEI